MGATILVLNSLSFSTSNYPPPANVRITNMPLLNNEEQVWICPTDSNIIIANWRDFRLGYRQVGIGRSTDGGLSWSDSLISQSMQVFFSNSWQSDPTLTVDRLGNFHISVLDFDASGFTEESYIAFYKSTDKGVSWTGPVVHAPVPNDLVFEDKQFITVDRTGGPHDGNLYCAWARFPNAPGGNKMAFVRSIDGGASFEDTIIIGPTQSSSSCGSGISSGQFPIPLVNSNGDVHCFWLGIVIDSGIVCSSYDGIKHVVSTDGGQTFNAGDVILPVSGWSLAANGTNIYSNPVVDADISGGPFDGNIYMAFTNYGPEDAGRSDVDFIRSTDNAVTWSSRYQINDDFGTAPFSDSYHPWLVVNEEGVVIVVLYDTRFDPPSHLLFDLVAAYSFDGGESFTSNHRISSVSSSAGDLKRNEADIQPIEYDENGIVIPPIFAARAGLIGEYIGVTAFHDKVNAVWTDSRDGNSEVYTANWYLPILEPRLVAPIDSAFVGDNPMFSWSTSWKHNEDRYRIEVSDDSDFSSILLSNITDTVFHQFISGLSEGNHYWRVKSFKTDGSDSSEYSEVRTIIVDTTPPDQPQLLSPINNRVTNNPLPSFDWSDVIKVAVAIQFDFYLSIDSTFPAPPVATNLLNSDFSLADSLDENVLYYWRVSAKDPANNSTASGFRTIKYINFICGDVNNDSAGPNILDLTYLVDYTFRGGPLPPIPAAADVDGSGGNPNILDLTMIVDRIFRGGLLPTCGE
jgi:hypothetical protein